METLVFPLEWSDWLQLFSHYALVSLLSFGGVTTATPELQRFLVEQHHWMSDAQFTAYFAIARASPGPNVLFVGLTGWAVGMNSGGWGSAVLGLGLALLGILAPSTTVAYLGSQWAYRNGERRSVRAFKQGMAPVVVALMLATGWVLAVGSASIYSAWPSLLVVAATTVIVLRSKTHLLWLLAAGALFGAMGWV
jgi:chromate transporter